MLASVMELFMIQKPSSWHSFWFSRVIFNLQDLEKFCQHYLTDDFTSDIWQNFSQANKERSLAWNKRAIGLTILVTQALM